MTAAPLLGLILALASTDTGAHRVLATPDELKTLLETPTDDDRPVVVHFWASWCGTCRREWRTLPATLAKARKRGARILLVSLDDEAHEKDARRILDKAGVIGERWRLFVEDPAPVVSLVDPGWDASLPATFVYRRGKRVASMVGSARGLLDHVPSAGR